jgi:glycosyltransferase involved in cell wall biosynthesis
VVNIRTLIRYKNIMRVLAITNLYPRPDLPALGIFNHQMMEALSRQVAVRVICLVPEWRRWRWSGIRQWKNPRPSSVEVTYLPVPYLPWVGRNLSAFFYRKTLEQQVTVAEDESIYTAWLYPDAVAVAEWARRRNRSVWVRVMGTDLFHLCTPARGRQIRRADMSVRGYICNARSQIAILQAAGIGIGRLHYVPNGVNTRLFQYRERETVLRELRDAPPANGRQRVLFAGNLVSVKAPEVALQALAQVLKTRKTVDLIVVGDGPLKKGLMKTAQQLNLTDQVFFVGRRGHEEIPLWMNFCDCLCLSSWSEGMPNVILEALASGLPVVATEVGACRDLLEGEPMARLVPPGDVPQMAKALDDLMTQTVDRAALAARHGKRSWEDQAAEVLALIGQDSC